MALMMAATFKAVGFDRPLCTARGFDAAVAASDLAPMQKVKVSGFHHQRQCLHQVSRGAAKLYYEHAPSLAASVPGAKRLDLQTGSLVTTLNHGGGRCAPSERKSRVSMRGVSAVPSGGVRCSPGR